MKNAGLAVGVVLIVVLLLVLVAGPGMMGLGWFGMMGPGMMGGYGGYRGIMGRYGGFTFHPVGVLVSLVVWSLIVAAVVWLAVWLARNASVTSGPLRSGSAIEVLKARYARGEITREQYSEMKKDIEG